MGLGWISKLKNGLSKTRKNTIVKITSIIKQHGTLDDDTLDEIEESLLLADIGVDLTMRLVEGLREKALKENRNDAEFVTEYLHTEMGKITQTNNTKIDITKNKPHIILVVGVNGVGKTTTIGKMANYYIAQNKKVLLAAGDTFRAAAGEQLELWAKRTGAGIIRHTEGSDPASVVYDSVSAAKARGIDILLIDTAGRLHTKTNLMEELGKIERVLKKHDSNYPHETILVLDATTGQNAMSQVKAFNQAVKCSGVVVTKLDGTAKGGIILSIMENFNIPVKMIGVGEGMDDLMPFNSKEYIQALFDL